MKTRILAMTGLVLGMCTAIACGDDGETSTSGSGGSTSATTTTGDATTGTGGDATATTSSAGGGSTTGTGGGTPSCDVVPGAWAAPSWDANTVEALALRAQLDTLIGDPTMRGAEQGTVVVDELSDLTSLWTAGTPSLADIATTQYAAITNDAFQEFVEMIAAGTQDLVDDNYAWSPGAAGGIYGSSFRGINEGGFEVRQLVDKGVYAGGGFYNYALNLTAGTINEATIDSIAALWGTDATIDPALKTDSANYSHGMGYFATLTQQLADAKAYAADSACGTQRDEALVAFFRTWEEAMYARFVYYAGLGQSIISAAAVDDDYASAFHELTEGLGLAIGFYGLKGPATGPLSEQPRVVDDATIKAIGAAYGVNLDDLGASTTGSIVVDPTTFAAAITAAEALLGPALGVSTSTIAGWHAPTAG